MPEGDTIFRVARTLHRALAGRVLARTDFRMPQVAGADLTGQEVLEVVPRGKHILLRTSGGWTLHTHLRMDGEWVMYRPGDAWKGPAHEIRVVLETGEWIAVGYRLPVVDLVRSTDEHQVVGHLGPDLLAEGFDADEAVRRLLERPERPVAEALLDQSCLAGIGNVFKCEVLFGRRVNPFVPVGEVADLRGVVLLAQRQLRANRENAVRTTTGSHRLTERHWVYDRAGRPCRRCGAPIRVATRGEEATTRRSTWWCPRCQGEDPNPPAG